MEAKLESLGLAQYTTILYKNGFEDWETVLDITEEDLDSLGFKRGHRRVLQREIATTRGSISSPDESRYPTGAVPGGAAVAALDSFEKRAKRRYRWHPRPDPNAPKRPKTAYVNFADHLRSDSSIASLSFVDIAREVGRRWQTMDAVSKQAWENQAAKVWSKQCFTRTRLTELRPCNHTKTRWTLIERASSFKTIKTTWKHSRKHQGSWPAKR